MRRVARSLVLYVVVPYLALVVVFALAQRKFLYPRDRVAAISAADAHLPAGQVHDVEIRTDDGLKLRGWLVLAEGQALQPGESLQSKLAEGRTVVLYFPGNSGSRLDRVHDCRDLTRMQCDVLLVDYRGYGDNPGSPSEEDLATDAWSTWRYLTADLGVPPERIVVFGESLGGGVATRLAERACTSGASPGAIVLSSTFSSMADAVSWHYPYFPVRLMLLDRYPSADYISRVDCPVLIFHGTRDDFVPLELSRKLFDAAPSESATGIAKRFVVISQAGHNSISPWMLRDELRILLEGITGPAFDAADNAWEKRAIATAAEYVRANVDLEGHILSEYAVDIMRSGDVIDIAFAHKREMADVIRPEGIEYVFGGFPYFFTVTLDKSGTEVIDVYASPE